MPLTKQVIIYLIITIFVCPLFTQDVWDKLNGPEGAWVICGAIRQDGAIFIGTYGGGVYRSDNDGAEWTNVSNSLVNEVVQTIAFKGNDIFVGTTYSGMFKSADNGETWTEINNGLEPSAVFSVVVDNSGNLFSVCDGNGVYFSDNDGQNWTKISINGMEWTRTLAINNSGYIFAGVFGVGIFRSVDGGNTWEQKDQGINGKTIWSLYIRDDDTILAGTLGQGIYESTDNSENWNNITVDLGNPYVYTINSNADNELVVGTRDGIFKWNSSNAQWEHKFGEGSRVYTIFSKNSLLFSGTWTGMLKSENSGEAWDLISVGLNSLSSSHIQVDSNNNYFVSTNAGVFRSNNTHDVWELKNNGLNDLDLLELYVSGIVVFAGTSDGLYMSVNSADNWTYRGLAGEGVQAVILNNQSHVFVGSFPGGMFRSEDWGDSWTQVNGGVLDDVTAIGINSNQFIFAGTWEEGVYRSYDNGETWTHVNIGLVDQRITQIVIDDQNRIYAGTTSGVSVSDDNGDNWTTINSGLANPGIEFMAISERNDIFVTTGGNHKVYMLPRDGTDWFEINPEYEFGNLRGINIDTQNRLVVTSWNGLVKSNIPVILPTPVLLDPADNSMDVSMPAALNWENIPGAWTCHIQVDDDNTFASPEADISDITSYAVQIPGLNGLTQYHWRVKAANLFTVSEWSPVWTFTTKSALAPPILDQPSDNEIDVSVLVRLIWSDVAGANKYSVGIAIDQQFNSLIEDAHSVVDNYYDPEYLNYNQTYYWKVIAVGDNNNYSVSETRSFTTRSYPASFPVSVDFTFPDLDNPKDFQPQDYKIVGIPGNSMISLKNIMPDNPGLNWQAYWDNGEASDYFIKFDDSNIFNLEKGRAFWVICQGELSINTTVPSPGLNAGLETEIEMHDGWNLVTNPFPVSISWPAVQDANSIFSPIFRFNNSGNFVESDILIPYIGYYFFNGTNLSDLKIPVKASIVKPVVLPEKSWEMFITMATQDNFESSVTLGLSPEAENGLDEMDYRKPRALGELPSVCFIRPEWDADYPDFATDIRKEINDIETWTFTVQHPHYQNVILYFEQSDYLSEGMEIYLIDRTNLRSINLIEQTRYEFASPKTKSDFEIIIGSEEVIGKKLNELVPHEFEIGENFPNPFNPITTIPVTLPAESKITLAVYDLLGKKIKTIADDIYAPGQYYFRWNGLDNTNRQVSAGIYFYRIDINHTGKYMGKMIMVK